VFKTSFFRINEVKSYSNSKAEVHVIFYTGGKSVYVLMLLKLINIFKLFYED